MNIKKYRALISWSKTQSFYLIIGFLFFMSCNSFQNPNVYKTDYREYKGGRWGYEYTTIKLYKDSTYTFERIVHNGTFIDDNGTWNKVNDTLCFNSIHSMYPTNAHKRRKKHFTNRQFRLEKDSLNLYVSKTDSATYLSFRTVFYRSY